MNYDVSKVLLFDKHNKLFIYLRDDKQTIPFPNMWDLLGGGIEKNESAEEAGVREVWEEVGVKVENLHLFGNYVSDEGFRFSIFWGKCDASPEELILTEGQRLTSINLSERAAYNIVPTLASAIEDFFAHLPL